MENPVIHSSLSLVLASKNTEDVAARWQILSLKSYVASQCQQYNPCPFRFLLKAGKSTVTKTHINHPWITHHHHCILSRHKILGLHFTSSSGEYFHINNELNDNVWCKRCQNVHPAVQFPSDLWVVLSPQFWFYRPQLLLVKSLDKVSNST